MNKVQFLHEIKHPLHIIIIPLVNILLYIFLTHHTHRFRPRSRSFPVPIPPLFPHLRRHVVVVVVISIVCRLQLNML